MVNCPGRYSAIGGSSARRNRVAVSAVSVRLVMTRYLTGFHGSGSAIALLLDQRVHLGGEVDLGGAPGDAPSTPDTAGGAELVVPGAQLVGQPLPVPAGARGADLAAVEVGVVQLEAGCPVL